MQTQVNEKDLSSDSDGGNGKPTMAGREILENKQFGALKKDRENEVVKNYIFQGTWDRMVPLAEIGKLQGSLDLKGGGKFN